MVQRDQRRGQRVVHGHVVVHAELHLRGGTLPSHLEHPGLFRGGGLEVCFGGVPIQTPGHGRTRQNILDLRQQGGRHEHAATTAEQGAFFSGQVTCVVEIAEMGFPKVGEHPFCGGDAALKFGHLLRQADARLDQGEVVVRAQGPKACGHPQLAVVAEGAAVQGHGGRQQLGDPFFHRGFAVAPGQGHHRAVEFGALRQGHDLHEVKHVVDHNHVAVGRPCGVTWGQLVHHKPPDALGVGGLEVVVPVVPGPAQGEEHGAVWGLNPPGVRGQFEDGAGVGAMEVARRSGMVGRKEAPSLRGPTGSDHEVAPSLAAT